MSGCSDTVCVCVCVRVVLVRLFWFMYEIGKHLQVNMSYLGDRVLGLRGSQ